MAVIYFREGEPSTPNRGMLRVQRKVGTQPTATHRLLHVTSVCSAAHRGAAVTHSSVPHQGPPQRHAPDSGIPEGKQVFGINQSACKQSRGGEPLLNPCSLNTACVQVLLRTRPLRRLCEVVCTTPIPLVVWPHTYYPRGATALWPVKHSWSACHRTRLRTPVLSCSTVGSTSHWSLPTFRRWPEPSSPPHLCTPSC